MENTFLVKVCKGEIVNVNKGTRRHGYWVPLESIPTHIAKMLKCDRLTARPHLAWDTHHRQWRDLRRAKVEGHAWATGVLATLQDGSVGIALLDF